MPSDTPVQSLYRTRNCTDDVIRRSCVDFVSGAGSQLSAYPLMPPSMGLWWYEFNYDHSYNTNSFRMGVFSTLSDATHSFFFQVSGLEGLYMFSTTPIIVRAIR